MKNNFLIQLQSKIKNLESKLDKPLNLKSKLEILNKLNSLKDQLTNLLEAENKSLESKYQTINAEKIADHNKQIDKASSRGKFSLNIKVSLLLQPSSLNNLSKSFKIETPKEILPRKLFGSETFSADYISQNVPDYKYFNNSEV